MQLCQQFYQTHPSAPESFAITSSAYFVKSSSTTVSNLLWPESPGRGRRDNATTDETDGLRSACCRTWEPIRPDTPLKMILKPIAKAENIALTNACYANRLYKHEAEITILRVGRPWSNHVSPEARLLQRRTRRCHNVRQHRRKRGGTLGLSSDDIANIAVLNIGSFPR